MSNKKQELLTPTPSPVFTPDVGTVHSVLYFVYLRPVSCIPNVASDS
jgi:hypothetical protein